MLLARVGDTKAVKIPYNPDTLFFTHQAQPGGSMTDTNTRLRQTLYKLLTGAHEGIGFSLDEIRTLCFQVDVPFDNLKGDTVPIKAIGLIDYLDGRGRLPELAALVYQQRDKSRPYLQVYYDAQPSATDWRFAHS